jgi:hypothetical protein
MTTVEQDVDISLETPTLKRQKFQELERPLVSTSTPLPNENISNIENRLLLRRVVESVSHTPNTLHILNNFIATAAHYRNLSPTQLLETIFTPSPNEPMISASSPLVNSEKYSRTSQREPLNDADFDWNSGFLFAPLVYGPLWPAVRVRYFICLLPFLSFWLMSQLFFESLYRFVKKLTSKFCRVSSE